MSKGNALLPILSGGLLAGAASSGLKSMQSTAKVETPKGPEAAKPLPIEDDEARRKARLSAMAGLSKSSGRESTMLARGKFGQEGEEPMTRSSILSMG